MSTFASPPPDARGSVWSSRAREVLRRVRGLEGGARRDALDRECGLDWTLHAEVVALLARGASSVERDAPARDTSALDLAWSSGDLPPDAVPGFRLLRVLGVGASGIVFEAEQARPRRSVALKVFRGADLDARLRQRIAHEAEVLARLRHPLVASVYAVHAGTGERGDVPWIAMELVRGTPLDAYGRASLRTVREKVELLAQVADAVGHAHACGVVHRDLKPGNVLVSDAGVPKVVDFGVARTLDAVPSVGTLHTQAGDLVGTLAYMSLEQMLGASDRVDARTDVHALGVLAYELLAGRPPRDAAWKSLPEWAALLAQTPRPLRDVAPDVPVDLSLVVGKALDPDRERRYPTAQALAEDLRRFLRSEPVLARAPTRAYLVARFVRRHRTLVGGAVATALALVAGIVVSLRFALESDAQRRRADLESVEVRRGVYRAQVAVAAQLLQPGDSEAARVALDHAPAPRRGWEWRYLDARLDLAEARVDWEEPLGPWVAVAPARDGRAGLVAGATSGGGLRVLDGEDGTPCFRIEEAPRVERAVWLADGQRLVVARADGRIEVRDGRTGRVLWLRDAATPSRGALDGLATSPTVALVVEARLNNDAARFRLLDVDGGTDRFVAGVRHWAMNGLAVDAVGRRLAHISGHGHVCVRSLDDDKPYREVARHSDHLFAATFVGPGSALVVGGADRRVRVYDVNDGRAPRDVPHQQAVVAITPSPDGTHFATWARERVLRVVSLEGLRVVRSIATPDVHEPVTLGFTEDGSGVDVVSARGRRRYAVGETEQGEVLRGHRGAAEGNPYPHVYDVAFSPDGRRVATAGWDGTVRVWRVATGAPLATLEAGGEVQAVAWSPDGSTIAAVGRPAHTTVWRASTGRGLASLPGHRPDMFGGITFTLDGQALLAPLAAGGVARYDARSFRRLDVFGDTATAYDSIAAMPDGGVLLGGSGGALHRVAPGLASFRKDLPRHAAGVRQVAVSKDGRWFATTSDDGVTRVIDAARGAPRFEVKGHVGRVYAVAFSPDGTRLATGGDDGTVRLHDVETGDEYLALRGHAGYVYVVRFSPDGETIASASGDNTARLWSLRSRAQRARDRDAAQALEAEVGPLVAEALAASATPEAAEGRLRARDDLTGERLDVALDVLLRQAAPPLQPAR